MSSPVPIFGTQNTHDDDGQVIDSFLIETDAPPDLKPAIEPVSPSDVAAPRKTTRILTGVIVVNPTWSASQLIPADANRKGLTLRVKSPTTIATDGIRIASDSGNVNNAGFLLHGESLTDALDNHTGEVFYQSYSLATGGAASAPVVLMYWSVTE